MMVTSPGFAFYDYTKILPKIVKEVPSIQKFLIMEDLVHKYRLVEPLERSASYEEYLGQPNVPQELPKVSISPHDMVNVQFTSGMSSKSHCSGKWIRFLLT